jgi:transcriptional regulator with XRE-family HTH domain
MPNRSTFHSGDVFLKDLGSAIRRERAAQGFSQEAFAAAAGLDRSYYGAIERGENNVTILNLKKIADQLELPLAVLLKKIKS